MFASPRAVGVALAARRSLFRRLQIKGSRSVFERPSGQHAPRQLARMHILCALELRRGHDESATTMHHTFPLTPPQWTDGKQSILEARDTHRCGVRVHRTAERRRAASLPSRARACVYASTPSMTKHTYDGLMTLHRIWIETKLMALPFPGGCTWSDLFAPLTARVCGDSDSMMIDTSQTSTRGGAPRVRPLPMRIDPIVAPV